MTNGVSIFGKYQERGNQIIFKGETIKYDGKPGPALGNYICSERFSGGTISAKVKFKKISASSSCEIILFRNPETGILITAGMGSGALFSIRYFEQQWTPLKFAGDRNNMKPNRNYDLKVSVIGSRIGLNVDGVEVLAANLPFSTPQTQVGIWCLDFKDIIITDFKVESQHPSAFVIMQFTTPYNELYHDVIKPVCERISVNSIRADETYTSGLILTDIVRQIAESKFIIADISPKNTNVYYELGYAHALGKPTILIAEKETELPFDVSTFRTLFYENSIRGKKQIEQGLEKHIKAILGI